MSLCTNGGSPRFTRVLRGPTAPLLEKLSMNNLFCIYSSLKSETPASIPTIDGTRCLQHPIDKIKELVTSPQMGKIIASLRSETDTEKRYAIKRKLPVLRPSILPWLSETYQSTRKGTGIAQVDIDHLHGEGSYERIRGILEGIPGVMAVFRSPSGDGIKALFRLFDLDTLRKEKGLKAAQEFIYENHRGAYWALIRLLSDKGINCADKSVIDEGRALFLSFDPNAFFSSDNAVVEWKKYDRSFKIGKHIGAVGREAFPADIASILFDATKKIEGAQEGTRNSECFRQGSIIARRLSEMEIPEDVLAQHKKNIADAIEKISDDPGEIAELRKAFTRGLGYSDKRDQCKTIVAPTQATVSCPELENVSPIPSVTGYFSTSEKVSLGIFPTGTGKSYASINKSLEVVRNGGKVLLLVSNKLAIDDTVKKLLKVDRTVAFETCQEENASPSKHAKIVISHHYYLRSRGCSNYSFPLYSWVTEDTTVIIDEADSLTSVLHSSIPVIGAKLVQGEHGDVENVAFQCPSRTTKSFRCHTCRQACPSLKWKVSGTVPELVMKPRKKDEASPKEIDLSEVFNEGFGESEIVHQTKLITMSRRKYLNNKLESELHSGVPSNSDELPSWVRDNIAESGYAYTLETQDVREVLQGAYAEALQQEIKKGSKMPGKEASKKIRSLQAEGALPSFPHYPCGMKTLSMLDTKVLSHICKTAKQTFMLTATLTPSERYALETAHPLKVFKSDEGRKVITNSLVVTTPLKIEGFTKDEEKWENTLKFERLAEDVATAKKIAKKKESTGLVFWHADVDGVPSWTGDARKHHSNCIAYARSAIARGANLPMFKTVIVDFQAFKPSIAYALHGAVTISEAVTIEKVSLMMQQLGRILRVEDGESDARRVLIVENCTDESGNDLSQSVNDLVKKEIEKMSSITISKVIDSTKIVHEGHHEAVIQQLTKKFIESAIVDKDVERKTLNMVELMKKGRGYKTACQTFPALASVCSEDQWAESWWRRYLIVLKKAHSVGLRGKELKDRVGFTRARKMYAIPASIFEQVELLFEKD